jgi:hypothetical protein
LHDFHGGWGNNQGGCPKRQQHPNTTHSQQCLAWLIGSFKHHRASFALCRQSHTRRKTAAPAPRGRSIAPHAQDSITDPLQFLDFLLIFTLFPVGKVSSLMISRVPSTRRYITTAMRPEATQGLAPVHVSVGCSCPCRLHDNTARHALRTMNQTLLAVRGRACRRLSDTTEITQVQGLPIRALVRRRSLALACARSLFTFCIH